MQVSLNNIYKTQQFYPTKKMITMPDKREYYDNNISFCATPITKPVMSTKINSEKAKMLRKLNEILKTNIPVLDKDQLWEIIERRAMAIIRMKNKKRDSFESELNAIYNSPYLSAQQKYNKLCEIEKEEKELDKIDPFGIPDYLIPKPTKENYDYKLIEKFKLALNDNNFDLCSIYQEHYSGLNDIETVKEVREKYPSLKNIPTFDEVIANKIIHTLTRDTYIELNDAVLSDNEDRITQFVYNHLLEKTVTALEELGIDDTVYISKFLEVLSEEFAKTCAKTVRENRLSGIPTISKLYIPEFTDLDKLMSQINYDSFALFVLKEHYLNGKKLNEIVYTENDKVVKVSDLKGSEYKFEKFSENIKRFITDSEKVKQYQREYLKFTKEELKERLLHYEKTELGFDDELFNLFVEFESCKFTEEDKNNLIVLLNELDKISDGKKTLEEGKQFLKDSNIHPHGTNTINEAAREAAKLQITAEQQKNEKLVNIRKDFDININKLYELGLIAEADMFFKYYPLTSEVAEVEKAEKIVKLIENTINNNDKKTAQIKFARWEAYNEYLTNDANAKELKDAKIFAKDLTGEEKADAIGQYLVNRNIVNGYPESTKLFSEPEFLTYIITQTGKNKDLATKLLCKYENYNLLKQSEKNSILNILKIFNFDNDEDRIAVKFIIENDYINNDTSIFVERGNVPQERTICNTAKQQLFDKYKFPNSVPFFEKFEQALPLDATFQGSAGVKKLTRNYKNKREKAEIKIMSHDDRLVADSNDYRFNRYDPIGIH